ncbi:MAG TPA: tRNA glutamyl-Q(34) synthetase GluQRS [Ktedonobacterales bacterium]|jgi:glutamyl-tRNA synthetase|nr:tRNA glutamyl-Q(34) synthetase GluQRS [Ktedonobacterales bacterium]
MKSTSTRGRYAPSPTGTLHLGNLRTALLAWLFARAVGGTFVLRIEDLDLPRVRPRATTEMLRDLHWLGLDWDEGPDAGGKLGPYKQSMRRALYEAAVARLRAQELIYPCYCTRAELARIASAPHSAEDAPRYPGTCAQLSEHERRSRETAGRRPSLRFRVPHRPIAFTDTLHGSITTNVAETVGDFIVRRSDGIIAYQLAVVVDDALMGITQVVRGADLLTSTARQLALYDALGFPWPQQYAHVPLLVNGAGTRLAKRDAAAGIGGLRARGGTREQLLGVLAASCGIWPPDTPASLRELLASFDPSRVAREPSTLVFSSVH